MSSFDFGDFEITSREIIASISIIAILLMVGVLISSKISEHLIDKNEIYNKAVKISDTNMFKYGMDTNIGNAFVYGDLVAVDPVAYPEVGGEYMSIEKVKEKHTKHTRVVTKTRTVNGKSSTYTTTETYWTWDVVDRWSQSCSRVKFLDIEFNYGAIHTPGRNYITTIKESTNIRYVYYGSQAKCTGTMFGSLLNGTADSESFYEGMAIAETIEHLESDLTLVVFWFMWIVFIGICVYGFYYLDNEWLE